MSTYCVRSIFACHGASSLELLGSRRIPFKRTVWSTSVRPGWYGIENETAMILIPWSELCRSLRTRVKRSIVDWRELAIDGLVVGGRSWPPWTEALPRSRFPSFKRRSVQRSRCRRCTGSSKCTARHAEKDRSRRENDTRGIPVVPLETRTPQIG